MTPIFVDGIGEQEADDADEGVADLVAVAIGAIHHLFGGFEIGKSGGNHVETQESEHAVPCAGTEGGVEQEFTEVHAR